MADKIYKIGRGILFLIAIILILIFKNDLLLDIQWLVGGVILYYGIEGMALFIINKKSMKEEGNKFFFALAEYIIAIVIFTSIREYANVCIIWAVWAIFRGAFEAQDFIVDIMNKKPFLLSLAESIIGIIFAIFLLLEPNSHHAKTHIYILVIELSTFGIIFPLILSIMKKYDEKIRKIIKEKQHEKLD